MAEKYVATAKVIDGILILSLPDALSPVVWQMELGQSKSSALEVRESTDGHFVLTLKTPRQDVLDIATYANRDLAVKALLVTSSALEKAHGQLKSIQQPSSSSYPVPAVSYSRSGAFGWSLLKKTLKGLGIFIGFLLTLWIILIIITKIIGPSSQELSPPASNTPMSADEFFENH